MLTLASLDCPGRIAHGFFTRKGGVSEGAFAALNCGYGSGDAADSVRENRRRAVERFGRAEEDLATPYQVHSALAVRVDHAWNAAARPQADGLVTDRPGLVLGILTADCVPVLLVDPDRPVIGAAHAGWKGARDGIVEATVAAMVALGARPERIRAGIGPAIRQQSYEVGPEFPAQFPAAADRFRPARRAGHFQFDLPGHVGALLARLGLGRVDDLGADTLADAENFFSFRRTTLAGGQAYGRLLSAIAIL